MIWNQTAGYRMLGGKGNFFAEAIIKKYKRAEEYAYQGVSLVFLETDKKEEEDPSKKSEVSVIYHLLLQEIYYKYYNQMVINRNEILSGIEQSIEQHLHLAKRKEPQGFLEVYSFYQEIKHLNKEKDLQKIEKLEKLIQERIGIAIEKIDIENAAKQTEMLQAFTETVREDKKEIQKGEVKQKNLTKEQKNKKTVDMSIVQKETLQKVQEQTEEKIESAAQETVSKEYMKKLIQKNTIEENRELYRYLQKSHVLSFEENILLEKNILKEDREQLKNILFVQIEKMPEYKTAQLVLEIKEKLPTFSTLYKIQEKFFHQIERVKEITNLTGQEYEIQQQVLLSLVRTAAKEEQQTLYQYFDNNHLIYTNTEQNNKNSLERETAENYETVELLQIVRDMDTEWIRVLTDKWKREVMSEIPIEKEDAAKDRVDSVLQKQKREKKQNRETVKKKEETAGYLIQNKPIGIEQTAEFKEIQDRTEQGLLYLQRKLEQQFGEEIYRKIKQKYLKNLLFPEEKIDDKIKEEKEEKKEIQKDRDLEKIWQIAEDEGIDLKKEKEKAVLFAVILTENQSDLLKQRTEDFSFQYRLEETIKNMDKSQIKNLVKDWKNEIDSIQREKAKEKIETGIKKEEIERKREKEAKRKEKIEETEIKEIKNKEEIQIGKEIQDRKESTPEKILKIKPPLTEIQRVKSRLLNLTEEGKPETIDFLYNYFTDRKLIYRQLKEEKENQETIDDQERTLTVEKQNQIQIKEYETETKEVEERKRTEKTEITEQLDKTETIEKTEKLDRLNSTEIYQIDKINEVWSQDRETERKESQTDKKEIETEEKTENLFQKRREIENILNHLEESAAFELLEFWQENKKLLLYGDRTESEQVQQRSNQTEYQTKTAEFSDFLEQKSVSLQNKDIYLKKDNLWNSIEQPFEKIQEKQQIKEYLLTKVEAGEPETIDSFYQYLTERKLIYRQQTETEENKSEEKQREIKNYLKKLQEEHLKEEIFISYWNSYLKETALKRETEEKIQKERTQKKKIQEKEISERETQKSNVLKEKILSKELPLKKIQTEIQTELEEVQQKRDQIEKREKTQEVRQRKIQTEKSDLEKLSSEKLSSEKLDLEKRYLERLDLKKSDLEELKLEKLESEKTRQETVDVSAQIQPQKNEFIPKDIRIYKEPITSSVIQKNQLYFSIMERYLKELQLLGIEQTSSEPSQQEKRIKVFLQVLEESSLEESNSFYQYMEQNHLLHYKKPEMLEQNEINLKSKEEEPDKKEILLEWIQSAAETTFYKLQEKWIEEYEKQQLTQIAQTEQKSIKIIKEENKISSVITRYFKALQTLSLQENKYSILEQQKQLLTETILEGSKEEKQNLYHYLVGNHFIYRKEKGTENERNMKSKTEEFSFDKKRVFIDQLKQLDKTEIRRILEQMERVHQPVLKEQAEKSEKKQIEFVLSNQSGQLSISNISSPVKLVYFRKNGKDLVIKDIRITRGAYTAKNPIIEYTKYSAEQETSDWIKTGVNLLYRKKPKALEESKKREQEREEKEKIQHYIAKTTEKKIHLESESTKKEMQEQQKELLLVKTTLKQQQEKIEEMERKQLKEVNSEKIYQMVMKKMEAQLRLERLRRGLS